MVGSKEMDSEQAEFWSMVAEKYDRVVDLQIGGETRAIVREQVAREEHLGYLVEFGCGTGFYTEVLAQKAASVLATDISPGMLGLAKRRVKAANVTFQLEDCQHTSLPDATLDTAFISLVLHFTEPGLTVAEMHRILRPGGTLITANIDSPALNGLARVRSLVRVFYQGVVGYRIKPPKGFGRNVIADQQLQQLLVHSGFHVDRSETIRDPSRASNIPIGYFHAVKA